MKVRMSLIFFGDEWSPEVFYKQLKMGNLELDAYFAKGESHPRRQGRIAKIGTLGLSHPQVYSGEYPFFDYVQDFIDVLINNDALLQSMAFVQIRIFTTIDVSEKYSEFILFTPEQLQVLNRWQVALPVDVDALNVPGFEFDEES